MNIELRWVERKRFADPINVVRVLQYRERFMPPDRFYASGEPVYEWSEWRDVPVEVE